MKTTLHIDMDKTKKDLIKTVASSRGLSMTKYLISLFEHDLETNRPVLPVSNSGDHRWPQTDKPLGGTGGDGYGHCTDRYPN